MKKIIATLTTTLLILTLISLTTINISAYSDEDRDYTFQNDNFYNSTNIVYNEQFNIRNQTEFTEIYNATYSFTNEVDGTNGNDITGFSSFITTDTNGVAEIISEKDNHEKVMKISGDGINNKNTQIYTDDIPAGEITGTIEVWLDIIDLGQGKLRIYWYDQASSTMTVIYINSATNLISVYYGNGAGGNSAQNFAYDPNVWIHLKYTFDCFTDKFSMYLNGIILLDDVNFDSDEDCDSIKRLRFYLEAGAGINALEVYIDALGYSWDSYYNSGDNVIPLTNELSSNEVDRWEFALQEENVLNSIGLDDPNGWDDYEESGDIVNVNSESTNDRIIYMWSNAQDNGIEKDDFQITNSEIVEVKWKYYYNSAPNLLKGNTTLKVLSNDSSLVVYVNLYNYINFHVLQYYDGSNFVNLTINDSFLSGSESYDFYLYINYYNDFAFLSYENSTDSEQWVFPLLETDKIGLEKISFINYEHIPAHGVMNLPIKLDSIGVYADSVSLSDEFAWKSVDLGPDLDLETHNLFDISLEQTLFMYGNISLSDDTYEVGVSDFVHIFDAYLTYHNYPLLFNAYTYYVSNIDDAYLIAYQVNYYDDPYVNWLDTRNLNILNLSIDGVKVNDSGNDIFIDYSYSDPHTDPADNYFYINMMLEIRKAIL